MAESELRLAVDEIRGEFRSVAEELKQRFDEKTGELNDRFEELHRHFDVTAERMESRFDLLAEGQQAIHQRIDGFRDDVRGEFGETRALVKLSYRELDRRVGGLEGDVGELRRRVTRLEDL
jgi:predicted nuclease with TOPRIM domain